MAGDRVNTCNEDEARRFTAYKVSLDGLQSRRDFVRGLSLEECRDSERFPFGRQQDKWGEYVWSYGINDGQLT